MIWAKRWLHGEMSAVTSPCMPPSLILIFTFSHEVIDEYIFVLKTLHVYVTWCRFRWIPSAFSCFTISVNLWRLRKSALCEYLIASLDCVGVLSAHCLSSHSMHSLMISIVPSLQPLLPSTLHAQLPPILFFLNFLLLLLIIILFILHFLSSSPLFPSN